MLFIKFIITFYLLLYLIFKPLNIILFIIISNQSK